jgi:hypothetical protein
MFYVFTEEKKIHLELDEGKILGDFRLAIQKTRSVQHLHHHHYGSNATGSSGATASSNLANINNRTSSRNNINNNNNNNINSNSQLNSASKSKFASIEIKAASKYVTARNGETTATSYASARFVSSGSTTATHDNSNGNSINKSLRNLKTTTTGGVASGSGSIVGKKKNANLNSSANSSDLGGTKRSIKKMKLDPTETIKVSIPYFFNRIFLSIFRLNTKQIEFCLFFSKLNFSKSKIKFFRPIYTVLFSVTLD